MVLATFEVRSVVERVCARQDVLDACAHRDLGVVIKVMNDDGVTQEQIAVLTGISQGRLSEYRTHKRTPKELSVFKRFADGLQMPPAARQALGLDANPLDSASMGVPQPRQAPITESGLEYPGTASEAAGNVAVLWRADLSEQNALLRGRIETGAWDKASLRWLVSPIQPPEADTPGGVRVGMGDVLRFRVTVEAFRQLDDRFGGGHGRQALIQYLGSDGDRLLRGRFSGEVGTVLFSAVAEATLLAAWMSYDSAPRSALAQQYFIQSLALAQAAEDRLLGRASWMR